MTSSTLAILGVVVLALAAAGVYRELSPARKDADGSSISDVAAASGALRIPGADTRRPLPELRFADGAGAPHSLAEFRGRVILLNVWATWCVPCRKEMPALDHLQRALGGPDFEVVALSVDHDGVFRHRELLQGARSPCASGLRR